MSYNLKSLYIDSYKGFKNFYIDFNNKLTVLIGENGTGKTTILEIIYNMLVGNKDFFYLDNFSNIELKYIYNDSENILKYEKNVDSINIILNGNIIDNSNSIFSEQKVMYFPAEMTFYDFHSQGPTMMDKPDEDVKLTSEKMSKDFKQYLVNQMMLDLKDVSEHKQALRIDRYKRIFNNFFSDKEFIDIDLNIFEPIFRLKDTGEIINTDKLSSGEKQIFFKGGSLLQYSEDKTLIVLIDEPEISLHPEWQQQILNFYRSINTNCQFIFSTHSSHIVSCCQKEEMRIIEKINGMLKLKENIIETYGANEEKILLTIFDLKATRNLEVQKKIEQYKRLYCKVKLNENEKEELENLKLELKNMKISDEELQGIETDSNTQKLKMLLEKVGDINA